MWHNRAILGETRFALNGNLAELPRLSAEIARFCQEQSLDTDVAFDLNLALEELFTNAVQHGGCEGMSNAVVIRLERARDGVRVEFSDRGVAFDPASAPPPDLESPLEQRNAGGLGIHLVRKIMSDLHYWRADDWNRITMRKPI
ncbi:MAG TPA: ATP-binding protein [Bryobacteraceae bacterium]|nr:ATP-binding protein [Bryobacteraceae bacterium]